MILKLGISLLIILSFEKVGYSAPYPIPLEEKEIIQDIEKIANLLLISNQSTTGIIDPCKNNSIKTQNLPNPLPPTSHEHHTWVGRPRIEEIQSSHIQAGTLYQAPDIDQGPENFRSFKFGSIEVAGSRRPAQKNLTFIQNHFGLAIILHDTSELNSVHESSLRVEHQSMEDFFPPNFQNFFSLLTDAIQAEKEGKNIYLHCGFGGGRTGTMLASLILYQKLLKNFSENPGKYPLIFATKEPIEQPVDGSEFLHSVIAHPYIKTIVNELRDIERIQRTRSKAISVETQQQANTLELQFRALVVAKQLKDGVPLSDEQIQRQLTNDIPSDEVQYFYKGKDMVRVVKDELMPFLE